MAGAERSNPFTVALLSFYPPLAKVKAFWANADIIVLSEQSAERLKNGIVDICGDECDMYFKTSPNTLFITKEDFLAGNYKLTNQPKKIVCDGKSFYLPDMSTNDIKTYNATKKTSGEEGWNLKKEFFRCGGLCHLSKSNQS